MRETLSQYPNEEIEKQKVKQELENQVRIKRKIESFFDDGCYRILPNEILVELGKHQKDAKIKAVIRPNSYEEKECPKNFSIQVNSNVLLDEFILFYDLGPSEVKHHRLICQKTNFLINGKTIKFDELCPDTRLALDDTILLGKGEWSLDEKTIFLRGLSCVKDFVAMLHEIGHAIDDKKRGVKDVKQDLKLRRLAISERNAWAEALKIARKNNIPITKIIQRDAQRSLQSYEQGREYLGITNESRKKIRRKKMKKKKR